MDGGGGGQVLLSLAVVRNSDPVLLVHEVGGGGCEWIDGQWVGSALLLYIEFVSIGFG